MKNIKYIFVVLWTFWCVAGISQNYSHYKLLDWLIVLLLLVLPYLLLLYHMRRKVNKENNVQSNTHEQQKNAAATTSEIPQNYIPKPLDQNITHPDPQQQNTEKDSTINQLETAQNMLRDSLNQLNEMTSTRNIVTVNIQPSGTSTATPASGISYSEYDKILARTESEPLTDDEVSYLIQVGREKAIAKWRLQQLTPLISESYQIMQSTNNPETLCSRYKFVVGKINELAATEQSELYDNNTLNQYKTLISDDNLYNLIMICYQKYLTKAKSELKTQNGVNNRINKFWNIIHNNVSAELYNKIAKQLNKY